MVPTTTVRGRKRQHVVAIPATVARHLVVATGTRVYWAMPRTGQALLSVKPSAARGPERREIECPSCAAYRKEVEKLRAQLAQRPLRVHNEGVSQGYGMAQRHLGVVADRVGRIEQLVEDISARLPFARRTRSARGARARGRRDPHSGPFSSRGSYRRGSRHVGGRAPRWPTVS
jgi:hypothetical protein